VPQALQDAIGFHLEPQLAGQHRAEAAIVHIASMVAALDSFDPDEIALQIPPVSPDWKSAGLREDVFIESLQLAEEQYKMALALFPSV
jgi:hypothetical protein